MWLVCIILLASSCPQHVIDGRVLVNPRSVQANEEFKTNEISIQDNLSERANKNSASTDETNPAATGSDQMDLESVASEIRDQYDASMAQNIVDQLDAQETGHHWLPHRPKCDHLEQINHFGAGGIHSSKVNSLKKLKMQLLKLITIWNLSQGFNKFGLKKNDLMKIMIRNLIMKLEAIHKLFSKSGQAPSILDRIFA